MPHWRPGALPRCGRLAAGITWIFEAQKIGREALAALQLFTEAARLEAATEKDIQSCSGCPSLGLFLAPAGLPYEAEPLVLTPALEQVRFTKRNS